ncbi:putative RING zinc finger domain superfamily protein [Iris pallida]|uniref:RING zinc finger domain superfamily protein n=1 Tax=Iris pallida TaxID=29817 RepID=A0AAX6DM74_IRIPA|nr:putative RING zinc finger domain superfamily protein [Iris pallida]
MPSSRRALQSSPIPADPPQPLSVDSDIVVVLAALLCALICVVGLALVARCAWLRRAASAASALSVSPPPAKGLKKKAIRSLPMTIYSAPSPSSSAGAAASSAAVDCPICLADFCEGDEMRALPQCGHRFHLACIDTWLAAHSSCPSCRHVLLLQQTSCDRCGAATSAAAARGADLEAAKSSGTASTFLP